MDLEDYQIESDGYRRGDNPQMGNWQQAFNFSPVSGQGRRNSDTQREFKQRIRDEIKTNYFFTHQVSVRITLFHNEEKALETMLTGDLDNYAKPICDAIKGIEGLIIDDCQIHSLNICWIDTGLEPYFEVEIKGSPDDFISDPITLYEMADKLYYPYSKRYWTKTGIKDTKPEHDLLLLGAILCQTNRARMVKNTLLQNGHTQLEAHRQSQMFKPINWGFHKRRITESGFDHVELRKWLPDLLKWLAKQESSSFIDELNSCVIQLSE